MIKHSQLPLYSNIKRRWLAWLTTLLILFIVPSTSTTSHASGHSLFKSWRTPPSLWQTLGDNFQIKIDLKNPQVIKQIDWYTHHQYHLRQILKRAAPYLYYIQQEVSKRKLPGELALMPMIESAYDPFSYSKAGASGLWQIMPGTGAGFGLKQNWWYDGRRDIYDSTRVALDYLTYLDNFFDGEWLLALAAYDSGEGTVQQAMLRNAKRHKKTDFWSLALPRETRAYVPRLLALSAIIHNPQRYHIKLPEIANHPYFDRVNVGFQIDLSQAAKLAKINLVELYKLNPGYNHWTTDPAGPHQLVLPIDTIEEFKQNVAGLPHPPPIDWQRHRVIKGDNLSLIAAKYNTSVSQLIRLNKLTKNTIYPGQTLSITPHTQQIPSKSLKRHQKLMTKTKKYGPRKVIYHIAKHDTMKSIANKYHLKPAEIRFWNQMKGNKLTTGHQLTLWTNVSNHRKKRPSRHHYTVKSGDSLSVIAHKLHVSSRQLRQWNKISQPNHLRIGQKLIYNSTKNS